jgi:diguanylate cyclase (GGDEF)-like protein
MKSKRLKHIKIALCALSIVLILSSCVVKESDEFEIFLTDEEREWLDAHEGKITIGYTTDYPPVEFLQNGEYAGISADYFKLLEEKLNVSFHMVRFDQWTTLLDSAIAKEVAGITAATKTLPREEFFNFTVPYIFNPNVIITRRNFSERLSFEKLTNSSMNVLVVEGYAIIDFLQENHPDLVFRTVPDADIGMSMVSFGEADALIVEVMSAVASIDRYHITNLVVNTETNYESTLSIATRNDWPILNGILNKGLAKISDSERRAILQKWIPFERKSLFENVYFWIAIVVFASLSVGVAVAVIVWNRMLRRLVNEKTKALEASAIQLTYKSYHDELTGLYNRAFYNESVAKFDDMKSLPLSIVLADLNGLKITNDTLGHIEGDRLLVRVAEILKMVFRKDDIIARIGGDEFVILLPFTSNNEVRLLSARIKEACKMSPVDPIQPSLAIGYATLESDEHSIEALFKYAEDMMYENKMYESESTHIAILDSLKNLLRQSTVETVEHSRRLEKISIMMGKRLDFSEQELNALATLADLHDLGKVAISEDILDKVDPLTEEEWDKIKRHPDLGFKIASSSQKLMPIAEGILAHHERFDGTGYPRGLKGDEIPLIARVISIVDAYDVMTNDRPYKEAVSHAEAVKEIKNCSGTQFDPELVLVFMEVVNELFKDV